MDTVSDLVPSEPPEVPIGDVLGDVPLFREIQRVLLSSSGPVNWELARQMAIAVASWGSEDPAPAEADLQGLVATVRVAELAVADATGLPMPADLAEVEVHRRAQWVEATLVGLRDLLEPVAASSVPRSPSRDRPGWARRPSDSARAGTGRSWPRDGPGGPAPDGGPGRDGRGAPRAAGLRAVRPGGAAGHGRRLLFVVPNIAAFERDWSLDAREFRLWVALHEVTHRFAFARPWTRPHFLHLVHDLVDHAELDLSGMERAWRASTCPTPRRSMRPSTGWATCSARPLGPRAAPRIARVQAFMAAAEGYADHVMDAVGPAHARLVRPDRGGGPRHREGRHGDQALERLLGLEMKLEQYRLGRAFCDTVAERTSEAMLARMWSSAESLPRCRSSRSRRSGWPGRPRPLPGRGPDRVSFRDRAGG